jgi:hypothetical protein
LKSQLLPQQATSLPSFAKHIGFPQGPKSYVVCNLDTRESTFYSIFTAPFFPEHERSVTLQEGEIRS